MPDETYYITPHEAALAVVATSMKKARLRLDTLIINSIVGGVLFTVGGMLHIVVQGNPALWEDNPGIIHLLQGAVYPIGLFYVVIMGADLYNSNILYFTVGVLRGAVSILDLVISWLVSWICNLGASIFVAYVICDLSHVFKTEAYVNGTIEIAMDKEKFSFMETFIKGIACNFCVCLAIYLQLLAKPIHVKLLMLFLPVFTFVSMGFSHAVADMFLVPMGLLNGAPMSVGKYIWKLLIPASVGNMVGGVVFSAFIPFYLHLVVVERDQKSLKLPEYDAKDEQPELGMDSRVIRVPSEKQEVDSSDTADDSDTTREAYNPIAYRPAVSRTRSVGQLSRLSTVSTHSGSNRSRLSSPPGVFPVLGMGEPLVRERAIATPNSIREREGDIDEAVEDSLEDADDVSLNSNQDSELDQSIDGALSEKEKQRIEEENYEREGGFNVRENKLSESLKRVVTNAKKSKRPNDVETGLNDNERKASVSSASKIFKSFTRSLSQKSPANADEVSQHLEKHRISTRAANASDPIAGISNFDTLSIKTPQASASSARQRKRSFNSKIDPVSSNKKQAAPLNFNDNDNFEEQSIATHLGNVNNDRVPDNPEHP